LRKRVSYGLLVTFLVVLLLAADHWCRRAYCFSALVVLLTLLAWREYSAMLFPNRPWWSALGAVGVALSGIMVGFLQPGGNLLLHHAVFTPAVLFLCALWAALSWNGSRPTFADAACWIFGVLYLGYLPTFLLEARHLYGESLTVLFLLAVKLGDSGAYFVGRTVGRHPIFRVSPRKTLEGTLGGLLTTGLTVLLGARLLLPDKAVGDAALLGSAVLIALAAQGGDLIESLLKRSVGTKHSAPFFAEMGGVLDMIDSVLYASPIFFGLAALARSRGVL